LDYQKTSNLFGAKENITAFEKKVFEKHINKVNMNFIEFIISLINL